MARILLGVSGGIAAYKALELIRLASGEGHAVRVIQTPASHRFVGADSFAALSGAPVLTIEFEADPARGAFPGEEPPTHQPLSHLELAARADVYVIAPATANTISKLAHGLADNLLCSCALAARCPLVLAPAMNSAMYEHPATQANLALLRERGAHVLEPTTGRLASLGEHGSGRMVEPAAIMQALAPFIAPGSNAAEHAGAPAPSAAGGDGSWLGLKVLVSAGGTREPIDGVRFIANSSSGRMGLALAEAAHARGASVTVVAANVNLHHPAAIAWRRVGSAAELSEACKAEFEDCDVLLMAAAVADFRPAQATPGKLKKAGREHLELVLEPTEDVLRSLSERRRPGQTLVGFAAEHGSAAAELARAKLSAKGLDLLVVNDVSRSDIGFDAHHNEVTIVGPEGEQHVPRAPKAQVADAILDAVAELRYAR